MEVIFSPNAYCFFMLVGVLSILDQCCLQACSRLLVVYGGDLLYLPLTLVLCSGKSYYTCDLSPVAIGEKLADSNLPCRI